MKARKGGLSSKARLETGATILAAAKVVDFTVIKPRMTEFTSMHRDYIEAQDAVDAAETALRKGRTYRGRCDTALDETVEGAARALVNDGEPRTNPFATFATVCPFAVKKMSGAEQAKTIRTLVGLIHEHKTASPATRRAAQAAERALGVLEAAQMAVGMLEASLRTARDARNAVGQAWDKALAALRRGARAAADDGAPGLHQALFGGLRRRGSKTAKAASAQAVVAEEPQSAG